MLLSDHHLPWSIASNKHDQGGTVLKTLLVMLLLGATSLIHGLLAKYIWAVLILLVLSAIACYFAFNAIADLSWKKIRSSEY
jgi:glucan phosphoethanolaminetransferase (alkaline phosphatase superfamily)